MSDQPPPLPTGQQAATRSSRRQLHVWLALATIVLILGGLTLALLVWRGANPASLGPTNLSFTLSSATRKLLSDLPSPIEIRYYTSPSLREQPGLLRDYAEVVGEVLEIYRQGAPDHVAVTNIQPRPDSDAEDAAQLDGVELTRLDDGQTHCFGLTVVCGDQKATLPTLLPHRERMLEYDISRCIRRAAFPRKAVLGILSSLPVWGSTNQSAKPWVVISELRRDYELKPIQPDCDTIPHGIDILMVHRPRHLEPATVSAIGQFVSQGGKAILLLDPVSVVDKANWLDKPLPVTSDSSLDPLLAAWGIGFDSKTIIVDPKQTKPVAVAGQPKRVPGFLFLDHHGFDTNDLATAGLKSLILPFAGAFSGHPVAGLTQEVLLHASADSQLVDPLRASTQGESLLDNLQPSGVEHPLALLLTGKFPATAGAKLKPSLPTASNDGTTHPQVAESMVVLIGDSDFLADIFCVRQEKLLGQSILTPISDNLNLIQALMDQLEGGLQVPVSPSLIAEKRRIRFSRQTPIHLPPAGDMDEMTRSVAHLVAMPVEEGIAILQRKSEQEYQAIIKELEVEVQKAQGRLNELQSNKTAESRFTLSEEQQQIVTQLKEVQSKKQDQLKTIRRTLRDRIETLEHLHGITNAPAGSD